jgi:hypothetical protein
MKYIVELKYTNPSHEHVSLRRRVESTSRLVEAANEQEAIFRASKQQKALGFMIKEAKATAVQEANKKVDFVKFGNDILAQRLQEDVEPIKEEIEQTDEALLPKQQAVADKLKTAELAANKEKSGYKFGKSLRAAKVAAKMKKEEVEQINELKQGKSYKLADLHKIIKSGEWEANYDMKKGKHVEMRHKDGKRVTVFVENFELDEENTAQYIEEKLTAADPASKWISDFVKSDNPKFAGKSKKERIQMALGAHYAAKRNVKAD